MKPDSQGPCARNKTFITKAKHRVIFKEEKITTDITEPLGQNHIQEFID